MCDFGKLDVRSLKTKWKLYSQKNIHETEKVNLTIKKKKNSLVFYMCDFRGVHV